MSHLKIISDFLNLQLKMRGDTFGMPEEESVYDNAVATFGIVIGR